ncbi:MAG: cyclase family protein [Paracoccaceae bacterium]
MKTLLKTASAIAATLALIGSAAWAESHASEDMSWTQSKYGPEDEIGAANLLSPELAKKAAGLVTTGKVYSLGIVLDSETPAFAPRSMSIAVLQPGQVNNTGLGDTKTTYNDDIFMGWLGIGSQIDGLGHIGVDHTYYNGFEGSDFVQGNGLTKLGIEKVPPIVSRGVMLDMAMFYGMDMLPEGKAYTREDIVAAAEQQGVTFEEGDVVLFHSGWLNLLDEGGDRARFGSVEPGLGKTGAEFLIEQGVIAVGADTWGLEAVPFEPGVGVFEIHQMLLAHNGIFILESMDTREMAKDDVHEFMFVLGQAKVRGAVQMIINPVAIR